VKDGETVIEECLDSLLNQSIQIKIVVVNDGSIDATRGILQKFKDLPTVLIVDLAENVGLSKARNIGFKLSESEISGFIDADGQADQFWAENALNFFDTNPDSCGIMASSVRFARNPEVFNGVGGSLSIHGYGFDLRFQTAVKRFEDHEVLYAMGNGLCIRSDLLLYLGGFDEKIVNYYDDVDICMRAWKSGFSVRTNGRAIVTHYFGHSSSSNYNLKLHMMERNRVLIVYKNYSMRQLAAFFPREILNFMRSPAKRRKEMLKGHFNWLAQISYIVKCRLDSRFISNIPSSLFITLTEAWTGLPSNQLGPVNVQVNPRVLATYGSFEPEKVNQSYWYWNTPEFKHEVEAVGVGLAEYYFYAPPKVNFMKMKVTSLDQPSREILLSLAESSINRVRIPVFARGNQSLGVETNGYREPGLGGRILGVAFVSMDFLGTNDLPSRSIDIASEFRIKPNIWYKFAEPARVLRILSTSSASQNSLVCFKTMDSHYEELHMSSELFLDNIVGISEILILGSESEYPYFYELERS
jgi:GT2 family glycosyltransferase